MAQIVFQIHQVKISTKILITILKWDAMEDSVISDEFYLHFLQMYITMAKAVTAKTADTTKDFVEHSYSSVMDSCGCSGKICWPGEMYGCAAASISLTGGNVSSAISALYMTEVWHK